MALSLDLINNSASFCFAEIWFINILFSPILEAITLRIALSTDELCQLYPILIIIAANAAIIPYLIVLFIAYSLYKDKKLLTITLFVWQCHTLAKNIMMKKKKTWRIDEDVIEKLQKIADEQKRTLSYIVNETLSDRVNKNDKK